MTNTKTLLSTFFFTLTITFPFSSLASYYQPISPTQLGFKEEKLTHLRFYFHDIVSGPNPTMVMCAESPLKNISKSPLPFGSVVALEDPLTEGPEFDSKLVGKAQGFYFSASQEAIFDYELVMGLTFKFSEGEYNGSTLSVLGRYTISSSNREMPIIGGTGAFRFARGFLQDKIYHLDHNTGNSIVEFNAYVFHYSSTPWSHEGFNTGVEFMGDSLLHKTI